MSGASPAFTLTREQLRKLGVDEAAITSCGDSFEQLEFGWRPDNGGELFLRLRFSGDRLDPIEQCEHHSLGLLKEFERLLTERGLPLLAARENPELTVDGRKLELPESWLE